MRRLGDGKGWGVTAGEHRGPFWGNGKVLELMGGDGYKLHKYAKTVNCII